MNLDNIERTTKEIIDIIDTKYNGDMSYYNLVEKEFTKKNNLLAKIQNFNNHPLKCKEDELHKVTHIDLLSNTVSVDYTSQPTALLGYSLDFLTYKRIFPFSLSTLLHSIKNKDTFNKTGNNYNKAIEVFNWVSDRILNTNFMLNSISLDKNNGMFRYNTTMLDANYGSITQTLFAKMDINRKINMAGLIPSGTIKDLSKQYNSLFTYFLMLGFTEFYAKCNCYDYNRKYSKRIGPMNYFCPHILYSMSQMPYYLLYYLK